MESMCLKEKTTEFILFYSLLSDPLTLVVFLGTYLVLFFLLYKTFFSRVLVCWNVSLSQIFFFVVVKIYFNIFYAKPSTQNKQNFKYRIPCEITDFCIVSKLKVSGPLQPLLGVLYEWLAQELAGVWFGSVWLDGRQTWMDDGVRQPENRFPFPLSQYSLWRKKTYTKGVHKHLSGASKSQIRASILKDQESGKLKVYCGHVTLNTKNNSSAFGRK